MSVITAENAHCWQILADRVSADRPDVGRTVRILKGKHKGKEGTVVWHGRDKYLDVFRYGGEASHHMTEMRGRRGYRVGVRTEDDEKFFTNADYTEVL